MPTFPWNLEQAKKDEKQEVNLYILLITMKTNPSQYNLTPVLGIKVREG